MGGDHGRKSSILRRKDPARSELEETMIYVILAIVFVVLLFAYMRVRSRRLNC